MKKLKITMRKGFQMTFENGLTASVQWGAGNYCDNYYPKDPRNPFGEDAEANNAEVAVMDRDYEFVPLYDFLPDDIFTDGDVAGNLTPEQIVDFLVKVKEWKPDV